ncbi:peroxidase [Rhizobium leguminosarum bv. viciae]|uniref:Dyp-type peroxidase n=1 Tax=Rhizobium leguminosarum TaxID=384 RepID=UPI001441335E|nr:peroxidase [Rhizobium leguminosarum]NKK88941.1 peroxidase [Rhizobium leguminosarum bv. viciae]
MSVTLNSPISWKNPSADDSTMLDNLQPNIIKAHVREFLTLIFLRFDDREAAKSFLRAISTTLMKSAKQHLLEIEAFKAKRSTPGTPYIGLGLTDEGYQALQIAQRPSDPIFRAGMQKSVLNDPDVSRWDSYFRHPIHAVVLVGDMLNDTKVTAHDQVVNLIQASQGVTIVGTQDGLGLHNDNREGIEHFGYVDGRSQPLFLLEDIDAEENATDGIANWDPAFPLEQVIVPDPAAPDPAVHFGSYFVYRKLEQNVRRFKRQEQKLADRLFGSDDERAGAMVVGRFEDGTPVTMQSEDGVESPVPNNFNYFSDKSGAKCPFSGHIRKTNPRGSGGFENSAGERKHLMARRGQTYGVRTDNPNDGKIENKPSKYVGLLFMAFNSDIGNQFEFTQKNWANNPGFPAVPAGFPPPGVDPVIGQTKQDAARPDMEGAAIWGDPSSLKTVATVPQAVKMKGGEYFFMPSLAFLSSL